MIYPVSMFDRFDRMTAALNRGSRPASDNAQPPEETEQLAAPDREPLTIRRNESANAGMFSSPYGLLRDETPPGGTGQARGIRADEEVIAQSQGGIFQLADPPTAAALPEQRLIDRVIETLNEGENTNAINNNEEQTNTQGAFIDVEQLRTETDQRTAQTQVRQQRGVASYSSPPETLLGDDTFGIDINA